MGHLGHSWPAKARGPQAGLRMALLNGDQVLDKDTPEGGWKISELGQVRWTLWEYSCFFLSLPGTEGWCGQTSPLHPSTCFTLLWSIWCFIVFVFTLCLPRLNFSNESRGGWYILEAYDSGEHSKCSIKTCRMKAHDTPSGEAAWKYVSGHRHVIPFGFSVLLLRISSSHPK